MKPLSKFQVKRKTVSKDITIRIFLKNAVICIVNSSSVLKSADISEIEVLPNFFLPDTKAK